MIETKGLRKSYRSRAGRETKVVEAVRGVDLSVAEGEIFGFLGPNGAGKTTTLRMLATLHRARRRRGHHRRRRPAQRPGRGAPPDRLRRPGRRHLGRVHRPRGAGPAGPDVRHRQGRGAAARRARRSRPSSSPSTPTASARPTPAASAGGSTSRSASSTSRGCVFLDEPTTGLDPQSRAHMWDEVRRLRDEGMTVFLTTHYLDEADALCDRIAIMDHGEIVAEGTPDDAQARGRRRRGHRSALDGDRRSRRRAARRPSRTCASWRTDEDGAAAVRRRRRHRHPADPARRSTAPASSWTRSSCTGPASTTSSCTKTGRSLREPEQPSEPMKFAPRHLAGLPAPDAADAAQPGLGLIVGVIQPLFYLLLFAPAAQAGPRRRSTNAEAYKLFVPGPAGAAGHVRRAVHRLRPDRRAARRRHRADPGHPGQPAGPAARPLAARRRVAAGPGASSSLLALPFGLRVGLRRRAAGVLAAGPDRADAVGGLLRRSR